MSLIAWYPLNGDLKNYGIGDYELINNNATISDIAKLSKSYLFNGTNSYMTINNEITTELLNDFSICCWVKINSWNTAYQTVWSASTTTPAWAGLSAILLRNGNNQYLTFSISNGSNYIGGNTLNTPVLELNKWYHIVCAYKKGTASLYVDGNNIQNYSVSIQPKMSTVQYFQIGKCHTNSYYNNMSLNDFRIYNHYLSSKEVSEIAKCKILHYPMNDVDGSIIGRNYILTSDRVTSGVNATGITSSYEADGTLKIIASPGNGNYRSIEFAKSSDSNIGNNFSVGDIYTISFDLKIESGVGIPTLFVNSGNSYTSMNGNPNLLNVWQRVYKVRTWAEPGSQYGNMLLHLGFNGLSGIFYVRNFKLEKGSIATPWTPAPEDVNPAIGDSGYIVDCGIAQIDGIISGSGLMGSSDTEIGQGSWDFSIGDTHIVVPAINLNNEINDYTIAFWNKGAGYSTMPFATSNNIDLYFLSTSIALNASDGAANTYKDDNGNTCIIDTTNWHHYCFTFANNVAKLYIDGEYAGSAPIYRSITGSTIQVAGWLANAGYRNCGKLCDYRIYATCLSDKAIKELYTVRESIDNAGNLYCNEIVEVNEEENLLLNDSTFVSILDNDDTTFVFDKDNAKLTITQNTATGRTRIRKLGFNGDGTFRFTADAYSSSSTGVAVLIDITDQGQTPFNLTTTKKHISFIVDSTQYNTSDTYNGFADIQPQNAAVGDVLTFENIQIKRIDTAELPKFGKNANVEVGGAVTSETIIGEQAKLYPDTFVINDYYEL